MAPPLLEVNTDHAACLAGEKIYVMSYDSDRIEFLDLKDFFRNKDHPDETTKS